jgi:hypothetical protein
MKTDEWIIYLPYDLLPIQWDDLKRLEWFTDYAINEARELAEDWIIPCEWHCELINGLESHELEFKVKRFSNVPNMRIGS